MLSFAERLIAWQKQHGRHDLPWQNTHDPYAIWVSEIMLQQTQVNAVIGYYQRFMQRFADIATLAAADLDAVLQHWSGLGYYARARNLHVAAQRIVTLHDGVFPQDVSHIQQLPGIGRSTAAAIASFAFGQAHPILDGNVKRVFARHFAVEGWPGLLPVEKTLWQLAENLLPHHDIAAYNQGLMDMGATLCTRTKPKCSGCPLQQSCVAHAQYRVHSLPSPRPRKVIPQKHTRMLLLMVGQEVLLQKRPSRGIWGGLWSLPETDAPAEASLGQDTQRSQDAQKLLAAVTALCAMPVAPEPLSIRALPVVQHVFTHFKLGISPYLIQLSAKPALMPSQQWLPMEDAIAAALPAPVRSILQMAANTPETFILR